MTLLPQEKTPDETPQLPFEEVMVKLEVEPDKVYVAKVWVDHVPADKSPPAVLPVMVAFAGRPVPVGEEEL